MGFPLPSSYRVLILIISISLPQSLLATNYDTCKDSTINCGNLGTLGYPFYDGSTRLNYCGYPGFEINCQGPQTMTIASQTYYVRDLNTTKRTITVAREDVFDSQCPTDSIAISSTLFAYTSSDENITLYYNCSSTNNDGASTPCNKSTGKNSYYLTQSMVSSLTSTFKEGCSGNLFVPVVASEVSTFNAGTVAAALVGGFELEWSADNDACTKCQAGGGECGYDWTNNKFACYCSDGTSSCSSSSSSGSSSPAASDAPPPAGSSSSGKSKSSSKTGVIAGIAAAVIVVVLVIFVGCYVRISRKKKRPVAHVESKDISTSYSSSGLPSSDDVFSTTKGSSTITTMSTANHSQNIPTYRFSKSSLGKGSTYFGVQVFSYEELEEATNKFHESRELGDGGFGTVYYGELPDGRLVAVKRLYENSFKRVSQFMNEVEILARIRHKNLVVLYGCTSKKSKELLLVYEFIPNGTVADHLHGKLSVSSPLTWSLRLKIAVETAEALAYLHASDVIHRDVKSNNILLDNSFQVKVADFGLSRLTPTNATHVSTAPQGTPGYVDPEYFQLYRLTEKSDVYSFGVVLIEFISSKPAVDTSRHRFDVNLANMAIDRIQNQALGDLVDPSLGFEEDQDVQETVKSMAELAFQCLQQEKELRPSMTEVLEVLSRLQKRFLGDQKQVVMNIKDDDDAVLLNYGPPPLSPQTVYSLN
ncbi:LEAF RUST 10 DISEASE-RESISTANCE LOCUS RECEPTOR-LIKE PROTEIN [Drosera capensis]